MELVCELVKVLAILHQDESFISLLPSAEEIVNTLETATAS
jgi:hypothetical protein